MGIIQSIVGCTLGVICYLVVALVTPISHWGEYSTGILVAMCLIWTAIVGYAPWAWVRR